MATLPTVCSVKLVAVLAVALTIGCRSQKAPPPRSERPVVAKGRTQPVVYRDTTEDADRSCLDGDSGPQIGEDLSAADVARIVALVQAEDKKPIISIRRLPVDLDYPAYADVRVTTGVGCHGPLTGHGHLYKLTKTDGKWTLVSYWDWDA